MTSNQAVVRRFVASPTVDNRNAVVAAYHFLCVRTAARFARAGTDHADLVQVAAIGLIKAVNGFRHDAGVPFETYARVMVTGELMHFARDTERLVRLPRRVRSLEPRYIRTWEQLAARDGREPTIARLAAELGAPESDVAALQRMRARADVCDVENADLHRSRRDAAIALDERIALADAMAALRPSERTAVLGTFGAGLTQREVGERLGVTQSQVSKILRRALRKLRTRVA